MKGYIIVFLGGNQTMPFTPGSQPDNGGTKRNEGGSPVLPKHAFFQMWPKPQEILRMIPKTKPDFEIPISSDAFEDYRILLFNFVF